MKNETVLTNTYTLPKETLRKFDEIHIEAKYNGAEAIGYAQKLKEEGFNVVAIVSEKNPGLEIKQITFDEYIPLLVDEIKKTRL